VSPRRRHDIDALRAGAFGLLILYHVAMLYVDEPWHMKSTHSLPSFEPAMLLINRWRMDLIFVLSGVASSFLLRSTRSWRFALDRSYRLLAPFIFGVLVLLPVQPYVEAVNNGIVPPGYLGFLRDYWCLRAWPDGAFAITLRLPLHPPANHFVGVTFNHLWYLLYLWLYSLALAGLVSARRSLRGVAWTERFATLRGRSLIWLPLPLMLASAIWLEPRFPTAYNFVRDWHRNTVFFTLFVYGYAIARDQLFWQQLRRLRYVALGGAVLWGALYISQLGPSGAFERVLSTVYAWSALLAILGWANVLLDRPFPWLGWANAAVFPWYVIHQSAIVLLAYWLVPYELSAPLEFAAILGGTALSCLLITAAVERVRYLRPWLGLKLAR
jgi:glucan biosynthesis protein C